MSKRIIFCADGTWDTPSNHTNVYKLFKALPTTATQIAFYDDGVGNDGTPLEKLLGGAFGDGLFQKIKYGYTKIAHVFEPGDEIFIFGFSRGAFTARSLSGMITACGLPSANFDDALTDAAFEVYRSNNADRRASLLAQLKAKYAMTATPIKMVGVWDTVGSLGIPALFGKVDPLIYGFLNTNLSALVQNAYHALAVDERRAEFPPTLWVPPATPVPGQTVEQVWFAGVHCDVGGGYPESGLSDLTLGWMMGKAKNLGLQIDDAVWAQYGNLDPKHALDQMHESWKPIWGFPKVRTIPPRALVANSVQIRMQYDFAYAPENVGHNDDGQSFAIQTIPVVADPEA